MGKDRVRFTGAVGTCALAHYDVAGAVVDYDADAYEGARRVWHCRISEIICLRWEGFRYFGR